jgi:hypothetical protein
MFEKFRVPWNEIEKELEGRVEEVFLKVFETIDDTHQDLKTLRETYPSLNEVALAHEIIKDSSKTTAMIGGGAAVPDLVPGIGWTAMVASLIGDYCLTLREEMGMLLKFSFLFDHDSEDIQREKDVISLLMFISRDKDKTPFAREIVEDVDKLQIDVLSRKIMVRVGVQLGLKFFKKKLVAFIPGIGIALSGGVNYLGTRTLGKLGIEFFQNKAEFIRVHGQSSTNLEVTKRASIQMMVNLMKMGGEPTEFQKEILKDSLEIFGYSDEERSAVNEDLSRSDISPIAIRDIRQMTDEDKGYVLKQGLKILVDSVSSKQENYLEFITRAFGLTQNDLRTIRKETREQENSAS